MGYFASGVDMPLQRQMENIALAGRMYTVASNNFSVTSGGTFAAISLFWTARNSKIIVFSAKVQNLSAANAHRIHKTTTDPNLSGFLISGLTIRPAVVGQANSTATLTSATEAVSSATGTLWRGGYAPTNAPMSQTDMLPKFEDYIIIPQNVAGGVLLLINAASTNGVAGELSWAEI